MINTWAEFAVVAGAFIGLGLLAGWYGGCVHMYRKMQVKRDRKGRFV